MNPTNNCPREVAKQVNELLRGLTHEQARDVIKEVEREVDSFAHEVCRAAVYRPKALAPAKADEAAGGSRDVDRQLRILEIMDMQPGVTSNLDVLTEVLEKFGHLSGFDLVRRDLLTLRELGLLSGVFDPCWTPWVAKLTRRGSDVAQRRIAFPGCSL